MKYRKITAIVAVERLEAVERALQIQGVDGVSLSQVRGYGEYQDFYKPDMMTRHARIEIFCRADEVESLVRCLMDAAHTGCAGDGIVAVLPVEELYCIRTKREPEASGSC